MNPGLLCVMMKSVPCGVHIRIDESPDGDEVLFEESLPPEFFDLPKDDELSPTSNVEVCGRAYHASEWIMVEATVKVAMSLPCSMCNERTVFPIELSPWKQNFSEELVRDGMLDVSEALREAILLEVPLFIKCGGDSCRNINVIRQFLAPTDRVSGDDSEERNQPFLSLL